jgi:hypothetical protein
MRLDEFWNVTKSALNVLLVSVLLSGCISLGKAVPSEEMAKVTRLSVIAMEAPPFSGLPHTPKHYPRARIFPILGAIEATGDLISQQQSATEKYDDLSKTPGSIEAAFYDTSSWVPTIYLAQESANQIQAATGIEVIVNERPARMPGVTDLQRPYNWEAWETPIKTWYNSDRSGYDYKQLSKKRADTVLEIGLHINTVRSGDLFIQIMARVIDVQSGKMLGRAREWSMTEIKSLDNLFADGEERFKDLFAKAANPLVASVLQQLGITPKTDLPDLRKPLW